MTGPAGVGAAGDDLREELARTVWAAQQKGRRTCNGPQTGDFDAADALLAGPLRRLTAERDEARAANQRVEALHATWQQRALSYSAVHDSHANEIRVRAAALRRALDGGA